MLKQMLRSVLSLTIVLFIASLTMSPALAAGGSKGSPTPPPPPPPPTGVTVDQQASSAVSDSSISDSASPVMISEKGKNKLLPPEANVTDANGIDANVTASTSAPYASAAALADTNWIYKTSFESGETIRYVGWVYNGTGSTQSVYLWWYVSTPCGSGYLWQGWITAPTGNPGWYVGSTVNCAVAGTSSFTFWTYYNGTYTSKTISYAVGILARAQVWVNNKVPYSQSSYTNGYRQDCSGYVSYAWFLGTNYGTSTMYQVSHQISYDSLQPGDALNSTGEGHIVLFVRWVDKNAGSFIADEENIYPKPAYARQHQITLNKSTGRISAAGGYIYNGTYLAIRKNGL